MRLEFPYTQISSLPNEAFPERRLAFFPYLTIGLFRPPSNLRKAKVLVDTGAQYCFLNKGFGKVLGLDVEKGKKLEISGIGGKKPENIAYFHEIELVFFTEKTHKLKKAIKYPAKVGFLEKEIGIAGVIGEVGFLDHFLVEFSLPRGYFAIEPLF